MVLGCQRVQNVSGDIRIVQVADDAVPVVGSIVDAAKILDRRARRDGKERVEAVDGPEQG